VNQVSTTSRAPSASDIVAQYIDGTKNRGCIGTGWIEIEVDVEAWFADSLDLATMSGTSCCGSRMGDNSRRWQKQSHMSTPPKRQMARSVLTKYIAMFGGLFLRM
jgi:hypothetical protein